ncbi:MAG: hypothetical protein DWH96_03575 [Planctomycetota bacterium]|nr:MAG: hypothetical protein DWH96_03575 [Planctomycetota bacterium]RLS96589.1 MAG: hypothetical protein DWI11_00425 [Planctomycetota bacterium]
MMTARHTGIACLAVLFCMFPSALGVSASAPTRWDARLEALDPTRPLDYFLLGEEVADAATNEAERQLARELFGLAGALDRDRLARSAALGRASLASTPLEKRRMQAAAALLGGTQYVSGAGGIEPSKALALSRALSYYRIGRGQVALATIRAASAESLLDEYDAMIPGGREGFERECRTLRGGTRPVLDNAALRRMLLLEAALLMPQPRPLSIDIAITSGAPLVEIDVSDLGALFRVDPKIAWWREGRWNVSL